MVNEFHKLTPDDCEFLKSVVGSDYFHQELEVREAFGHDETEDLNFPPEAVLIPGDVEEISKILGFCNSRRIPVTPIGGQTGLSGGALCVHGGVALSMKRFNKILDIDLNNLQVITEPGVVTQVLQEAVEEHGLYYAPDPASRGSCFIGGNLAENSGGPRAVKYGVTKDWVLNLEVVLANGEVIWTGANTLKNSTGYNLTQLLVGSEGTLGIITKAVLKLIPKPKMNLLMLAPFRSATEACQCVSAIFRAGVTPSALEFMERDAIQITAKHVDSISFEIDPLDEAHLLIEVDGSEETELMAQCEIISKTLEQFEIGDVLFADSEAQKNELWKLRRKVGEAVKMESTYKEEDTVVPRYRLPELLEKVKALGKSYGFRTVCYGHAGDGNLHINILRDDLSEAWWSTELTKAIRELFEYTVSIGGTLSGEHGIGLVQRDYMDIAFSETELSLLQGVKDVFDPKGILNPGKVLV
jgi:glycolate oxidase